MPTVLQSLNPSGTPSHFTTQQPSGVPTLTLAIIPRKKPSHITSNVSSDYPSYSLPVAMSVHTSTFPNITPTTLPSDFEVRNPVKSQALIHYRLQMVQ